MKSTLRDYRSVGRLVGVVMIGLGFAALACGLVALAWDALDPFPGRPNDRGIPLYITSATALLFGVPLYRYGSLHQQGTLGRREALLAVSLIWIVAGVIAGMPFVLGAGLDPASAFFEAVSAMTTTGATAISDIEGRMSRGALLWRALIQWLGGMGIVVLFVAIFPSVGAGSKHLFRGEVPGATSESLKPRIRETSYELWRIYAGVTALCFSLLVLFGMGPFDAVCHAMSTLATGGFSTRDASVSAFNSPAIEYVIGVFMLVGAVNFGLYYAALSQRSLKGVLKNFELRTLIVMVVSSTLIIAAFIYPLHDDVEVAIRKAFFMVGTAVSTTGYTNADYMAWPKPALTLFLFLMFIGGSSGSTAGGLKIERLILMWKRTIGQLQKSYRPNAVLLVRMGRQVIPASILEDVGAFFVLYMGSLALGIFATTLVEDVSITTAFGACLTCLANSGPHPFYVGADYFADYSAIAKLLFSWLMLLGRLEFYTLLALFMPGFWRR